MNAPRPTLGVVVPCRNERAVIARKLLNLALLRWPETDGRPHRIVVVDDGSEDGTAGVAGALAGQLFPPHRAAPFGPVVEDDFFRQANSQRQVVEEPCHSVANVSVLPRQYIVT